MVAAVTDDVVIVLEHAVGEPVVAHELPDVLHHVQLRALRRQGQQGDVVRHRNVAGEVPSGLIKQQHGVFAGADHGADLCQVQVHRRCVAQRQDEGGALAFVWADGTEDVGRRVALVLWRRGPGAAPCPAAGDAVLLADAGFIGEPDLYRVEAEALVARDACQRGGKVFLNVSMAPSAWA